MFEASPGVFKDPTACETACIAYSMEEGKDWVVVKKTTKGDKGPIDWYRPCRVSDLLEAKEDDYNPIDMIITEVQNGSADEENNAILRRAIRYKEDRINELMDTNLRLNTKNKDLEKQLVGFQHLCIELEKIGKIPESPEGIRVVAVLKAIEEFQKKTFDTLDSIAANVQEPQSITSFPNDLAGFDLAGWKHPDGTVSLHDQQISEFPKEISCLGNVYCLEEVKECGKRREEDGAVFCNALYC